MGLLNDETTCIWSDKRKLYFINKGYIFTKRNDKFKVKIKDLPLNSVTQVKVKCDGSCDKEFNINYNRYISSVNKYGKYYCQHCANKPEYTGSKNEFILSEDSTYWIGITQKGEEFWFDGDEETIRYIKSCTWRKLKEGYFQNGKGDKLHRVIMNITNPDIYVNHLGGNRWDNRKEKLTISDHEDNSKEKQLSIVNNSGIVGLLKRRDKWCGNIKINHVPLYSKYSTRDDALIDLLIMQRYYGFRHNENLYYMLDNISELRIKEVINNTERQIKKKQDNNIISTNKIELSEDKTFYWVYDNNLEKENNRFKVSLESVDLIKTGLWRIIRDKNRGDKEYIHGDIIINGVRKTVKLHRYLMDLLHIKYKNWYIDHLNGEGLNNTLDNLVITDAQGNGLNKPIKGYSKIRNLYCAQIIVFKKSYTKSFKTENEAKDWVLNIRQEAMKQRLQFHSRAELDIYLHNQELVQAV